VTLDDLTSLVRSRRTSKLVDRDRPVPFELVTELCDLAQWAPNHKRTWPWRFVLLEGDARARFGEALADAMAARGDPSEKVSARRTKYLATPATLVVGTIPGDSELRTAENRDATAAGVENLLLGATAAGLASYWSTCPKGANEAAAGFCDFPDGTHITAIIYLGWPARDVEVPERPPVHVDHLTA
jgi:nitroreductase